MRLVLRAFVLVFMAVLLGFRVSLSQDAPFKRLSERVDEARHVVDRMLKDPDFSDTVSRLLKRCRAIMVFPSVTRGGFLLAGRFGRGVMLVKMKDGASWSPPAFYTVGGGSIGFQAGIQKIDLVLFVMNGKGVDALMKGKVTLGVDMSVAMGPVGVSAAMGTDVSFKSEIYAYSRAKGVFAGVSLKGATIRPDLNANCVYYGRSDIIPRDILVGGKLKPPRSAVELMELLKDALKSGIPTGGKK